MRLSSKKFMLIITLLLGLFSVSLTSIAQDYSLTEVSDGIYSYGNGFIQTGIVVSDDGVAVLDPMNSAHAELTLQAIQDMTDQPIRYVIYSHNHWDHVGGGQVFKDVGATIMSHIDARDWLVDHPNPDVVVPDEVWEDDVHMLELGDKTIELHYFGLNHGEGMVVARFGEDNIIFTGDLVVPNRVAFANMPDFFPAEWERTLTEIQELEYDTVMFTHNAPFGPSTAVDSQLQYLQDLRAGIFAELQAGTDFMAVPDVLELPQYADWDGYDEWLSLNAWRVLMEIAMGW